MQDRPEPNPGPPPEWTLATCVHLTLAILGWYAVTLVGLFVLGHTARSVLPAAFVVRWMGPATFLALELVWLGVLRQYAWRGGVKPLFQDEELRDGRFWAALGAALALCEAANLLHMGLAQGGLRLDLVAGLGPVQWGPSALVMGAAVGLVPVAEEWFFRGIVQGALTRRWGASVAVPVTAVLFGALHGPGNLWVTSVYGLVFGWLAHRRSSLTLAILVHAGVNLVALGLPLALQIARS
ncbi:MAG: family intrarane metalloprotease [Symbiobacteriaceae bacterium]|nr:family intrarane metalloprotease [Symbiobacteriaceae bacterium]